MGWATGGTGGKPQGVLAGSSKKGGGLFGLGVGPSWGLSQIWHGAEWGGETASGLVVAPAAAAYHTAAAASYGLGSAMGVPGAGKAAKSELGKASAFPVGLAVGAGQGLSNIAELPAIVPGVEGYGDQFRRAWGRGLAQIGTLGTDINNRSDPRYKKMVEQLTPPSFQELSKLKGGILNPAFNTLGVIAVAGHGAAKGLGRVAETASEAGDAATAARYARGAAVADRIGHPLRGAFADTLGKVGQAAQAARNAADVNLNPEMRGYYEQHGKDLGMRPPTRVIDTERMNLEDTGRAMADEYARKPVTPADLSPTDLADTQRVYGQMAKETGAQYEYLTKPVSKGGMGVTVEVVQRADNPYANPETGATDYAKMYADIKQNRHLFVDATSADESHPFLTPEQNNQFRAVHDAFGHSLAGNEFGAHGEEVAYQHHSQMYSPEARRALAMETRYQNSALNYSPENLARAAAGEPKQFDVQRAGLASAEHANPEFTRTPQTVENMSPTAMKDAARRSRGPAAWAEKAVEKMPGGANGRAARVLAKIEDVHVSRQTSIIRRELGRYADMQNKVETISEPFIQANIAAEDILMSLDKSITRQRATGMIGEEVAARLIGLTGEGGDRAKGMFGPEIERARALGYEEAAAKIEAAGRTGKGIPEHLHTPEVEQALQAAVDEYPGFSRKVKEGYFASDRLGNRGLDRSETENPEMTKAQRTLSRRIDRLELRAERLRQNVPAEVERLRAKLNESLTRESRSHTRIMSAQEMREEATNRLTSLREHVEPTESPKSAKQMVRATPAGPNEIPVEQQESARNAIRQGVEPTKEVLHNALPQEKPNAALKRGADLAYSARDIQDAGTKIAKGLHELNDRQETSLELSRQITEEDTPSARKAAQAERIAAKARDRLSRSLANTGPGAWPRAAQPIGYAYQSLMKDAATDPQLRAVLGDAKPTWQAFVARSIKMGLDPQYVADITPDKVARLLRDPHKLDILTQNISGARKDYTGQLQRLGAADRSVEAFAAAMNEMHNEIAKNVGVDYIEKNIAVPVAPETVVDPHLWAEWDAAKQHLVHGVDETGNIVTKAGTRYVIPKALETAIRIDRAGAALGGMWWVRALNKVTNPWRTAVITASPAFYVTNLMGAAIMATTEGVKLGDWAKSWQAYRERGTPGNAYDMVAGHAITTEINTGRPILGDLAGMKEGAQRAFAQVKAEGDAGKFKAAKAGLVGGIHGAAAQLHNVMSVTDSIARTAVYLHNVKEADSMHALNLAYSSIIDYGDLSAFERSAVRAVVPFYSYMKGILKIVGKMPIDHPMAMSVGAQLQRVIDELQKDAWGSGLTSGYSGIIPIGGGGGVDLNRINPFKDASRLATPDGIAGSLNPFLGELVRYGLHVPSGGTFSDQYKLDPWGRRVADLTESEMLDDIFGGVPGVQAARSYAGEYDNSPAQTTSRLFGFNVRDKKQMDALVARINRARASLGG